MMINSLGPCYFLSLSQFRLASAAAAGDVERAGCLLPKRGQLRQRGDRREAASLGAAARIPHELRRQRRHAGDFAASPSPFSSAFSHS